MAFNPPYGLVIYNHDDMQTISLTGSLIVGASLACHFLIQLAGTLRLRATRENIGGAIKGGPDLDKVRGAIQTNLLLGVPLIGNMVFLMAILFWVSDGWLWAGCVGVLAVGQTVSWFVFRPTERQFKALPVAGNDSELTAEYRGYLEQWAGFNLFLKPRRKPEAGGSGVPPICGAAPRPGSSIERRK
jgi:hypothetical protein